MKKILSATLDHCISYIVDVEVSFSNSLPALSIVGLASSSIQEAKDRVKAALLANDFTFPAKKITVNLSPSDLPKKGSHFDVPIALAILFQDDDIDFGDNIFLGELGLDGKIKDTSSIYPIVLNIVRNKSANAIFCPKDSVKKLSNIPHIKLYPCDSISELSLFFKEKSAKEPIEHKSINHNFININNKKYYFLDTFQDNFLDVKGQEVAKRAALISVCGMHNIIFKGSPGCGKSMISKRMQYILPPMSIDDILDKANLDSLNAKEPNFTPLRSIRAPHHSSTKAAIFGGGSKIASIGEVALANGGILFFDELLHFPKQILEALREPMEDNRLLISRVHSKINYKASFLFIGAMNPCPCGNLLSIKKDCRCTQIQIDRYNNTLSGPFLDRVDIFISMQEVDFKDKSTLSSKDMRDIVFKTFKMQKLRGQDELNGKLSDNDMQKYITLDKEAQNILEEATKKFTLSFRAITKCKKVARTIADIDTSEIIKKPHILEALSYRYR